MDFFIGLLADGVTAFAVLFLASLGLYITYGLLKVINMAHGDMIMIGAYSASQLLRAGLSFWAAALISMLLLVVFGLIVERVIIRQLHDRNDLSTLLATWGLSLCIIEAIRLIFGPSGLYVDAPTTRVLFIGQTPYPAYSLMLVCSAVILTIVTWFVLQKTRLGAVVRATMEAPEYAEANRINTRRVYSWGFAIGAGLAGLGGALIAPISAVTPQMGLEYSPLTFLVIIAGGLGPSMGRTTSRASRWINLSIGRLGLIAAPIAGVLLVAGTRSVLSSFFGVTAATIGMLILVLIVLMLRPNGMVTPS